MKKVKVTGRTSEEEHSIEVDSLFVIGDDMGEGSEKGEGRSFWESASLEELAEEQGTAVVSDLDSIAALWPADDDPDALLDFILDERRERRRMTARVAQGNLLTSEGVSFSIVHIFSNQPGFTHTFF